MHTGRGEGKWKVQRALGNSTRLDLALAGRRTRPTVGNCGATIWHSNMPYGTCVLSPLPPPTPSSSSSPRATVVLVAAIAAVVVIAITATGVTSYHEPAAYLRSLTYKPQPIPVYLARLWIRYMPAHTSGRGVQVYQLDVTRFVSAHDAFPRGVPSQDENG